MSKPIEHRCLGCKQVKIFRADQLYCSKSCMLDNPINAKAAAAKILVLDIETAGVNALNADLGFIVNFGYQIIDQNGPGEAKIIRISDYKGWWKAGVGLNDFQIVRDIVEIMKDSDIYVAHYGKKFDIPYIRSRCLYHHVLPPPPNEVIDPCYIGWKNLKLSSMRLKNVGEFLDLVDKKQEKIDHQWPDWWHAVLAGSKEKCEEMGEYCRQDVKALTEEYLRMRSFDKQAPRLHDVMQDENGKVLNCGNCGSKKIAYSPRPTIKKRYQYRQFQCLACGFWDRESKKI